MLTKRWTEFLF